MDTSVLPLPLSELHVGETFQVVRVDSPGREVRRRLADMGLHAGAEGELLRIAPLGDPLLVRVLRTNVSLRRGEAQTVLVARKPAP